MYMYIWKRVSWRKHLKLNFRGIIDLRLWKDGMKEKRISYIKKNRKKKGRKERRKGRRKECRKEGRNSRGFPFCFVSGIERNEIFQIPRK